jgi:hypothetical protein
MTESSGTDIVLKADRLGRIKTPADRRAAILEEYDRSGMSGPAFAGHYGIKYQTFAAWLVKRRRQRSRREPIVAAKPLRLVEAVMDAGTTACTRSGVVLRVELPGGAALEMNDESQAVLVAQLLRALAGSTRSC